MPTPTRTAADLMTREPLTLPPDAVVGRALALMKSHGLHEIPVLSKRRFVGMVTMDTIAHRTNLSLSTRVENLLVLPPRLSPTTEWDEVARQLLLSGLRAAPVVGRNDRLEGVVSRTDIVRALPSLSPLGEGLAEEIASPLGDLVGERDGIGRLINAVRDESPVAVVDRQGRLVGSIGVADLGRAFWRPKRAGKGDRPREKAGRGGVLEVEARSIMRSPAVRVPEGTPIHDVVRRMVRSEVSSVFVTRDDVPVGAVTQTDLLEVAIGGHPSRHPRGDVFYRLHGFALSDAPTMVENIDRAVGEGLSRIGRRIPPVLLDLSVHPEGVHRLGHVTVTGRLHTPLGILRARSSGWEATRSTADVLLQLERQARRLLDRQRRPSRSRRMLRRLRHSDTRE